LAKLEILNKPVKNQVNYKAYLKKSKNEIEGTAAVLFLTYKNFFSSQDQPSCVFTPSCSVYAMESLQHDNPFVAYLKIFDRLQRCHPLVKPGEYTIHQSSMRYYDPSY
jgi:putative membrane protein insertion efficiency factor